MRIAVIGGSNSVRTDGWVPQLAKALPQAQMTNLAVGAANSLMGYFQLSQIEDFGPGDIVIWEYALNDENQIRLRRPLDLAKALTYIEATIRWVQGRGATFLPVIFRPRVFANSDEPSDYRPALAALFARYGVDQVDPYALYAAAHGGADVPALEYSDHLHLHSDGAAVRLTVAACAARLAGHDSPRLTRASADLDPPRAEIFKIVTDFAGIAPKVFENSLMRRLVWQPGPRGVTIYRPDEGCWKIIAVMTVAQTGRAYFALRAGDDVRPLSCFHEKTGLSKPLMRMQDIAADHPFVIDPQRPLELVGWEDPDLNLPARFRLGPLPDRTGLTGLLLERMPAAGLRG